MFEKSLRAVAIPRSHWEKISPLVPLPKRRRKYSGRKPLDNQRVLEAIIVVLWGRLAWKNVPDSSQGPSGMTCLRRLKKWKAEGSWIVIQAILEPYYDQRGILIDWKRALRKRTDARVGKSKLTRSRT